MKTTINIIKNDKEIRMDELEPFQMAIIVGDEGCYEGNIVMRTQSSYTKEIMNLSNPEPDRCWSGTMSLKVRPVTAEITIKINGE